MNATIETNLIGRKAYARIFADYSPTVEIVGVFLLPGSESRRPRAQVLVRIDGNVPSQYGNTGDLHEVPISAIREIESL